MDFDFSNIFKNFNLFGTNKTNSNENLIEGNNKDIESAINKVHMYGIPQQKDDDVKFRPDDGNKKYGIPPEPTTQPTSVIVAKYAIYPVPTTAPTAEVPSLKYGIPPEPTTAPTNIEVPMYAMPTTTPTGVIPDVKYGIPPEPTTAPTGEVVSLYSVPQIPTPTTQPSVNPNPGSGSGVRPGRPGWSGNSGYTRPSYSPFRFSFSNMFNNIFRNINSFFRNFFGR